MAHGGSGQPDRMKRHRATALTLAVVLVGAAACSDDTQDAVEEDLETAITEVVDVLDETSEDAVELAARNFAAVQAGQEFEDAGHVIDGVLTCEADATNDLTAVEISCVGTTVDGGEASMSGTTSEFPGVSFDELDGDFVGTVDGAEVFSTERLGG